MSLSHFASASPVSALSRLGPGLFLAAAIALMAVSLHRMPGLGLFSPMILAIAAGMLFHNIVGTPARAKPGVGFAMRRVLRFAIILLGAQLTLTQVREVGLAGVAVIASTLTATFLFTKWIGRKLRVERKLAELIAAGTSICGASAVIAVNTVTEGPDEDVAYAVACVTVFGAIAMFVYPMLPGLLHLAPRAFGLWAGASIHEIAQVVAAAYQDGQEAGDFATIAKLTRVAMLAPLVIGLGFYVRRKAANAKHKKVPLPWFVLGFIALMLVNSLWPLPAVAKAPLADATGFLLAAALGAMGLETDIRKLKAKGLRPLLLGLFAFLFVSSFALMAVKLTF
jgi:uncharacterized integral membrane protein (TIGR00698 family)